MNNKQQQAKAFRRLLAESRAALRLTKTEAARRLRVPYRTYQNWELGYRIPPDYIQRFAVQALVTANQHADA